MDSFSKWRYSKTTAASLVFATTTFAIPSFAANELIQHSIQPLTSELRYQHKLQITQNLSDNCAEVVPSSGVYVRREPSVYSEAIGVVEYGSYVTIAGDRIGEWMPISAPVQGYVAAGWLTPCYVVPEVQSLPEL